VRAAPDAAKPLPVTAPCGEPNLGGAQTAVIVLATSVAVTMLNVAPIVEPSLQRDAHFSAGGAGAAFSVELAAMGLASLPAAAWIGRSGAVRVARVAHAVFIAGSLLSAAALDSFAQYAGARSVAGIGAGMLMVLGMSLAARAGDPDRLYALITFAQLASGAALLAGLAALTDVGRVLDQVFLASAGLGVLGIATAGLFTGAGAAPRPSAPPPAAAWGDRHLVALALAFALVFNLVVGAVWPFAAAYAVDMASARIAQVLAGATVAGLAGAALALLVGNRAPRRHLLIAGYLGIALGAGVLHFARHPLGFAAGCCVFSLAWNFSVPYVFAAVAGRDRTGALMGVASLAFAAGLALGPLLAGMVLDALGLDALFPALLPSLAIGIVLTLRITSRSKR
jgi:predicted MFS family arabinose efflux permease